MTGDDLRRVVESWAALDDEALGRLEECLAAELDPMTPSDAADCAAWLVGAVGELVGRLAVPTELGRQARALAASWPGAPEHPRFACEGRAWLKAMASASVAARWTADTEAAWCHAWHLLAEVLDEDRLSPFLSPFACPSGDQP